ncbi:hypothetical protein OKW35_002338 [Paraburkholderia sp. MM5477-R1]
MSTIEAMTQKIYGGLLRDAAHGRVPLAARHVDDQTGDAVRNLSEDNWLPGFDASREDHPGSTLPMRMTPVSASSCLHEKRLFCPSVCVKAGSSMGVFFHTSRNNRRDRGSEEKSAAPRLRYCRGECVDYSPSHETEQPRWCTVADSSMLHRLRKQTHPGKAGKAGDGRPPDGRNSMSAACARPLTDGPRQQGHAHAD